MGAVAWLATVGVASVWQLATRYGVSTDLTAWDLALLRYTVPALVLSPLLWRRGLWPGGVKTGAAVGLVVGAGLPFGLMAMAGAQFAPAAHMGAVLPGAMPLMTCLLCVVVFGDRFPRAHWVALGLIVLGVAWLVGPALWQVDGAHPAISTGHGLFLGASVLWALYTVSFRASGINAWYATALIAFWSSVCVVPLWLAVGMTQLWQVAPGDLILQVFAQGLLAGVVGLAAYNLAIAHLGAAVAATSGAAVPIVTAAGGAWVLGEGLTQATLVGVLVVSLGIGWLARARA
ncbi:MAG: DMT family transporter [Pseudomonadota bacterium]